MLNEKNIKTIKWSSIVLIILGFLIIHYFIPRLISEIRNPVVGLIKRNKNVSFDITSIKESKLNQKEFYFNSFDGLKLSARLNISSLDSTKGTIILLHGIRSNKDHFKELS